MAVNKLAYFFAGAVLGAAGLAMVKSGKGQQLISGIIHGGCGLTESVLARVETVKEDVEDYMAEVKYKTEQEKKAASAEMSEGPIVQPEAAPKIKRNVESAESDEDSEEEAEIQGEDPRQFYR